MSAHQFVRGLTLFLISLVAVACATSYSPMVSSAASTEYQAYAPRTKQVGTRQEEPAPKPEVEEPPADEDEQESKLVRRQLTDDEKKSVAAAYKLERKKAIANARKQRKSEDQLTRGIYERELAKIAATLEARKSELRAAKKAGTKAPEQIKRELAAARAAAKLARKESSRAKDDALKAAAVIEGKAVEAAKAMYEQNCEALDELTVADFEAPAR
jgi:colicin import membrane protein